MRPVLVNRSNFAYIYLLSIFRHLNNQLSCQCSGDKNTPRQNNRLTINRETARTKTSKENKPTTVNNMNKINHYNGVRLFLR